jgi:hypothetical protein
MHILAALFLDSIEARQVAGPSTRLDLAGVQFSAVAPKDFPFVWAPHLAVIVHCAEGESATGALEVVFQRDGEQIARNVQPLEIEPTKFSYRLVRAEMEFVEAGTVEAHCRIDMGPVTVVPYTILPPVHR